MSTNMRIGFTLPQFGALAVPGQVAGFARRIEEIGGDSLWVADRLLSPVNPAVGYSGAPAGTAFPEAFQSILDPFVVLTIAASATEHVRIGTNVLDGSWYPPALLARSLTSIDVLSGGRLVVGLGSGWSPEEFEAVGVPIRERGARLDECLEALEALWTSNPAEYHGRYWSVPATHVRLRPVQRPRPPVFLAGFTPAAWRRVALRGDGWLPAWRMGEFQPTAAVTGPLGRIREMAEQNGRDPASIATILRVYPVENGTVAEIVDTLQRAGQEAGVTDALVDLVAIARSTGHALELAEEILGKARLVKACRRWFLR
jgi:probable F420-dependent oxidoreductase